jgi:hypothetical protein
MVICCGTGRSGLPWRRERHRRVLGDLGHAADEEAALILDGDRTAHETLLRVLRRHRAGERDQQHCRGDATMFHQTPRWGQTPNRRGFHGLTPP